MSKYPKIYGFCDAGCRWETVHMDDFQKAAYMVACGKQNDVFTLEPLKTYRIKKTTSPANSNYGFAITLSFLVVNDTGTTEHVINIYNPDDVPLTDSTGQHFNYNAAYKEFLTVRFCDFASSDEGSMAVFEIDGKIFYIASNVGIDVDETFSGLVVAVSGAEECYLINESAEILAHVDYDVVNQHVDEVIDDTLTQVYGVGTAVVGNTLKIWCDERFTPVTVNESTNTLVFR